MFLLKVITKPIKELQKRQPQQTDLINFFEVIPVKSRNYSNYISVWILDNKQSLAHCHIGSSAFCQAEYTQQHSAKMMSGNCFLQTAFSPGTGNKKTNLLSTFPCEKWTRQIKVGYTVRALLKRWNCTSIWHVAVCGNLVFAIQFYLPGARTSGLPFFATVFWRFMTRLCLPGIEKAWFSVPPCGSRMICAGGRPSGWTWERV